MVEHLATQILFWIAFLIDIAIFVYAFKIYQKIKGSYLANVALYSSITALIFGLHHLAESFFHDDKTLMIPAEALESVAALFLLITVYYLFKTAKKVFVLEKENPNE